MTVTLSYCAGMKTKQTTKPAAPTTSDEIMRSLGSRLEVAIELGVTVGVAAGMYTDGIPHRFHQKVIDAARKRRIPGVTRALLAATYKKPDTAKGIITAFGGRIEVATLLDATRNAVSNWYMSGIPPKYHHRLVEIAHRLGIPDITVDLLEATHTDTAVPRVRRACVRRRCANCGCTIVEHAAPLEHAEQQAAA